MANTPSTDSVVTTIVVSLFGSGGAVAIAKMLVPVWKERLKEAKLRDQKRDELLQRANDRLVGILENNYKTLRQDFEAAEARHRQDIQALGENHRASMTLQADVHKRDMGRLQALHRECEERCRGLEDRLSRMERIQKAAAEKDLRDHPGQRG